MTIRTQTVSHTTTEVKGGGSITEALYNLTRLLRDNARTPFNWDSSGAFSSNTTSWTPAVNLDINLADQVNASDSVYSFWTNMIRLRKSHKDVFVYGEFEFLDLQSPDFLAYRKKNYASKATVIINMSNHAGDPPVNVAKHSKLLAQTQQNCSSTTHAPLEGHVYHV